MATIRSYVFMRHARVEASSMLVVFQNGQVTRSGSGISVWFLPQGSTSLLEVPADDRDHVITVSATTRDFQIISVQGIATWRAADALKLARRVDFSIDSSRGTYRSDPLSQIDTLLDGLIKSAVEMHVAVRDVSKVMEEGVGALLAQVQAELARTDRLAAIGIELVGVRLSDLTPSPDLVRALKQPTVERLQQTADESTFKRRANAVEKEAEIAENETKAKIALEQTRSQLIDQERQNELAKARALAEKAKIDADSAASTREIEAQSAARVRGLAAVAEADAIGKIDQAKLNSERERAEIAKSMPAVVVVAEAFRHGLASAKIGTLNLGPDTMSLVGEKLAEARNGRPKPT
jgi:regulator of protease activity HflC (stomatin/prohibitin superfamily)